MTMTVLIPATIDLARKRLTALDEETAGLQRLLIEKGWGRAAVVYAFTYEGVGHFAPSAGKSADGRLTIAGFAKLRIAGLATRDTVAHYRNCWTYAMEHYGAKEPTQGQKLALPDKPFPPSERGTDGYDSEAGARKTLERIAAKHPGLIEEAGARIAETRPDLERVTPLVPDADEVIARHRRRVEHEAASALDSDVATQHLNMAAREVAESILAKAEFGVRDVDAYTAAYLRLARMLAQAQADDAPVWSAEDTEFLRDVGVTL